jgi:predicted amidohydrolase
VNFRVALANLPLPKTPEESVALALQAIRDAAIQKAGLVCFPECFVPGYPDLTNPGTRPDATFLSQTWAIIAEAAAKANIGVILGIERVAGKSRYLTALVITADGTVEGFQDKVQLDPSEDRLYTPGTGRQVFHAGSLTFGIVICHEGFRYPETTRWAVRHGAQIVFHPHYTWAEPGAHRPTRYAEPENSFHEKAALCRAAENTCYFATVNCASEGSPTTSAVINPDGTLLAYQPYGHAGLLIADIETDSATGYLASRYKASK